MNYLKLLIPVALLALAGCASKDSATFDDGADGTMVGEDGASTYGSGTDADGSATAIDGAGGAAALMNDRIIYFAFDSADIDSASMDLLTQHGQYLAANPGEKVRIEGHTDESGTREYNIGLGERRAVSVQSVLLVQGATMDQLVTISFGEERPAAFGADSASMAQNRRVELAYER